MMRVCMRQLLFARELPTYVHKWGVVFAHIEYQGTNGHKYTGVRSWFVQA